jgi:hypothetical protein
MRTFWLLVRMSSLLTLLVALTTLSAFADPPSRAVRIKYISGPVSIQPGGVNDWTEAVVNRPLTTSDRVWTDKEARAELHLGSAALRMNAETSMTLTNVSDDIVQIELDQGTLNLHIRHLFGGETYEIDTPNQAFTILKAGDYRFDVDPNADTTSITVWHGEGEANGQGPGVKLKSGHQASFTNGTSLEHQMASASGLDGFDDWCRVRDDREDHARSYEYVSADVVGADDLDEYGTWRTVPTYGAVWVPAVAPGWAPYHYGHWVWVEPWGWTWVDDAPWGFAPCHYGRWVYAGGFWAWAPGPVVVARPVYAPALVAWVGGPHFGVSLSFGGGAGVAWFPLGWGEPYVPSYHVSRTYFQQVNVTNTHITNITNVTNNYYVATNNTTVVNNTNIRNIRYVNQNVAGAVTAVPTRAMANSESVSKVAVAVNASEMRNASVVTAAAVAPERSSVLGARAGAPTMTPPARAIVSRPVVSRMAPPAKPIPFEARQEALAKTPGRPLDAETETRLRTTLARQPQAPPAQAASQPSLPGKPNAPAANNAPAATNVPIAPRPLPRPGGLQSPLANTRPAAPNENSGETPKTPASASKPGSPAENAPPATNAPVALRPVPRPGGLQAPVAEGRPAAPSQNAASEVVPANAPVRNIPRPPQAGGQPSNDVRPTASSPSQPAVAPRPVPRPPQMNPAANSEAPRPVGRPAPSVEVERPSARPEPSPAIRPTVQPVKPEAPRAPQNISMPRGDRSAPENNSRPQPQASAPRQTESAPRPQHEAHADHAPKTQQPKHEEKAERHENH